MAIYTINKLWYDEVKNLVAMANPYEYEDLDFGPTVEVEVLDVETFKKVSRELGWMY